MLCNCLTIPLPARSRFLSVLMDADVKGPCSRHSVIYSLDHSIHLWLNPRYHWISFGNKRIKWICFITEFLLFLLTTELCAKLSMLLQPTDGTWPPCAHMCTRIRPCARLYGTWWRDACPLRDERIIRRGLPLCELLIGALQRQQICFCSRRSLLSHAFELKYEDCLRAKCLLF